MTLKARAEWSAVDVINGALGVMLAATPWIYPPPSGSGTIAAWSAGVIGGLVALLALVAVDHGEDLQDWATLLLGVTALVAPWVLGFAQATNVAGMHALTGLAAAVLSGLRLAVRNLDPPGRTV